MVDVELLLDRLEGVRRRNGSGWSARCPSHPDNMPSLSVNVSEAGRVLVHCFAGCAPDAVIAAVGLSWGDLSDRPATERTMTDARYVYRDRDGTPVLRVVRTWPKRFHQEHWTGDRWEGGADRRCLLYRLDQLAEAVSEGRRVYVLEGEKDVDRLWREGEVATCNPMGAGKWSGVAAQARDVLKGCDVVVVADRDEPGRAHAGAVLASLVDVAGSVRVVEAAAGKDVSDHLDSGRALDELVPIGNPDDAGRTAVEVKMSTVNAEAVSWLWPNRLPLGKLVVLDGDPSVGKSTMALDLAARVSAGAPMPDGLFDPVPERRAVVLMSAEDGLADTIKPRLLAAGADPRQVFAITAIRYRDVVTGDMVERPPAIPDDLDQLEASVVNHHAVLVVIDVLTAYLSSETNSYRDQDVRRALAPVAAMAERQRCCVVVLRHLRKASTGSALYAGGGSIAIVGAARVGLRPQRRRGRKPERASARAGRREEQRRTDGTEPELPDRCRHRRGRRHEPHRVAGRGRAPRRRPRRPGGP
jgi:putative DNA primase/helicase